jgi:hypothetical protein
MTQEEDQKSKREGIALDLGVILLKRSLTLNLDLNPADQAPKKE